MNKAAKIRKMAGIVRAGLICLLLTIPDGCNSTPQLFTIGMVNDVSIREPALAGFKAGMAELGYVEGKSIKYIYNRETGMKEEDIDAEIKAMLSQKVDILLAFGNAVAFRAKKVLEGTDTPIVVVAVGEAVKSGLVESMAHPGGNLTGLHIFDPSLKGLEWLKILCPSAKKVFLPFDAADSYSHSLVENLKVGAAKMGIELVSQPIRTADEAAAAIESLPDDIDVIYRTSAPGIDSEGYKISQAAISRRLPIVAASALDDDVLLTCGTSVFEMGRQTARFADQIRLGHKPADLPIETAEVMITVNLKTAGKIGFHVPDAILLSAKKIIR